MRCFMLVFGLCTLSATGFWGCAFVGMDDQGLLPPAPGTMAGAGNGQGGGGGGGAEICISDADCVSGFCVDGVCCATQCSDSCFMCNLPGSDGVCTKVPVGVDDPTADIPCLSTDGNTCRYGLCDPETEVGQKNGASCQDKFDCAIRLCMWVNDVDRKCGRARGDSCALDAECAVGVCTMGKCGYAAGADCISDVQCVTNHCVNNACQ